MIANEKMPDVFEVARGGWRGYKGNMKFCVVGAGAWGTAFALHLSRGARAVALVPRRPEQAAAIASSRENREYLPGILLPNEVRVTASLAEGLCGADVILLACPAQTLRLTAEHIREALGTSRSQPCRQPCQGTRAREPPAGVAGRSRKPFPGSWWGPSRGRRTPREVARGLPAAMVLAAKGNDAVMHDVQAAISGPDAAGLHDTRPRRRGVRREPEERLCDRGRAAARDWAWGTTPRRRS